ncbi:MAG: solute carrier family 23 protein, partial [Acidobacteriota bacterium]
HVLVVRRPADRRGGLQRDDVGATLSQSDAFAEDTPAGDVAAIVEPLYRIDERPERLWEAVLYGWQHTLVDISPFVLPLAVAAGLGLDDVGSAALISACLVAMGLATWIQTTVGNRLPIVQGPSAPLAATMGPLAASLGGPAMWGGVFAGALLEAAVGASRIMGLLRRFFPPAVAGTVVLAIGLSLGQLAARLSIGDGSPRTIFYAAAVLAVVFTLQTAGARLVGGLLGRGAIFFAIWAVGLGIGGAFGDVRFDLVADAAWIAWPTFFPYGGPGFGWTWSIAAFLILLAGYLASMVESLGDYAATCTVAGERYRVEHMNRGLFAEGIGCALASCLGALPCTSYTQNVGILATTRVASRFVVQLAGGVLLLYGLCPKFGALLVALPRSVLGGVFVIVCGSIVVSGIRLIQTAPATPRQGLVIGTTLILAFGIPTHSDRLGLSSGLDLLVGNPVVLAVVLAVGLNALLVGRDR